MKTCTVRCLAAAANVSVMCIGIHPALNTVPLQSGFESQPNGAWQGFKPLNDITLFKY